MNNEISEEVFNSVRTIATHCVRQENCESCPFHEADKNTGGLFCTLMLCTMPRYWAGLVTPVTKVVYIVEKGEQNDTK